MMQKIRCAIYTRKSSDDGLEQDFNSLDAQREACSAFVRSQASLGWIELAERYDDGGFSGGTLDRPALKRLLGDVAAGYVDIVLVYKVDRLRRSLFDFAKLMDTLETAKASFASITQALNTTSSMGRLTLNMLLSFAQFEREVTAERIRDKLAASKAKGMSMGGVPPLGYRPDGRSLAVITEQAALVQHIFERYLVLGNVRRLAGELNEQGIIAPLRTTGTGRAIGGVAFTRGMPSIPTKCVHVERPQPTRSKIRSSRHCNAKLWARTLICFGLKRGRRPQGRQNRIRRLRHPDVRRRNSGRSKGTESMALQNLRRSKRHRLSPDCRTRPTLHQNMPHLPRQCLARIGFGQQLHARVQPAVVDDRILGIARCEQHGDFRQPLLGLSRQFGAA